MPVHLQDGKTLPRNSYERILWIRRRVEQRYYDNDRVRKAVADAFLDPFGFRRAGDNAVPSEGDVP